MGIHRIGRLSIILALAAALSLSISAQDQLQVGYTVFTSSDDTQIPVGTALFSFRNSEGVLVSQAGVGATEPILRGRIFVDEAGTATGIAFVNPSLLPASVTLILRDATGTEVDRKTETIGAGRHLATFVFQLFGNLPEGFTGSLTFESTRALAAITLRESRNAQGEPLYTTLPVVDLDAAAGSDSIVVPHLAVGDGYQTQLILINATAATLLGKVSFRASSSSALSVDFDGKSASELTYQIEPHGTFRVTLDRTAGLESGYALVIPAAGNSAPSGTAIFLFKENGTVVTEAGVAASESTTTARVFVDYIDSFTGIALVNRESQVTVVSFALMDTAGQLIDTTTRTIRTGGHLAIFVHEIFPQVVDGFTGLMEIRSPNPISTVTLKLTINAREDQVLTTLPVADLDHPPAVITFVFPQIAIGAGFSTQLIFINTDTDHTVTGKLRFRQSDGAALAVPMGSKTASEFTYQLTGGGGRLYLPGNTAQLASIAVVDPSTDQITREIAVNEGNTVRAKLLVVDTTGTPREDFDLSFISIDPEIATVDTDGNITGNETGFSTLTISSGGVVTTATINVVTVSIGAAGHKVTGVVQDLARRLYLAATPEHTILRAESLQDQPEVYAGRNGFPGLKNDVRLQSLFKNPGFLALNQKDGTLYASDAANHVIRQLQPGPEGGVETLAGTGEVGITDGTVAAASFNTPQGVALDSRGTLWVVDSGNHTIRRIHLSTGEVETIAGKPGSAAWADGTGEAARFSAPKGISIETDAVILPSFLEDPGPPEPITVIVADTGNGLLRRVKETGEVETIRSGDNLEIQRNHRYLSTLNAGAPVTFSSPTDVAVDPFGNIYVTEPTARRVSLLLQTGDVVPATERATFTSPTGIVVREVGKAVVADTNSSAREIAYGVPEILSITPDKVGSQGGDRVTIKGRNFSSDSLVIAAGVVISDFEIKDTQTINITTPELISGLTTLTVQNRGGLAQRSLLVEPVPLAALPPGHITTVAGGSTFVGDGSPATLATLFSPEGIALDSAGNIYIADTYNHRIRRVDATTGIITTIAGNGLEDFSGDGGPATAAALKLPTSITFDTSGNLFIADWFNNRVRKVDSRTRVISTVAETNLGNPKAIAFDALGNLFIGTSAFVLKVDAATQIVTAFAGNGEFIGLPSGDGGPATEARLGGVNGIAFDSDGNLFVAINHRIRKIDATTGIISTVAGVAHPVPWTQV